MKHREGNFSGATGKSIYFQYWEPDEAPRALVLVVHGVGEHSSRYAHLASYFCERGFVVAGLDHIGHGKSEGRYGFVECFSNYTDTLEIYRQQLAGDFPALPMILLGHSMGGLISACLLLRQQDKFVGCVLSGPAIKTDLEPPWLQILLIRLLSLMLPKLGVLQLDANGVSRDAAVVADYCADPLVFHGKMSARSVSELFAAMHDVQARASEICLPLLLLHGSEDSLTAPAGSQFLYDTVSSAEKTLKIYPGLYHEIFNEPEQLEVFADLYGWCEQCLQGGESA